MLFTILIHTVNFVQDHSSNTFIKTPCVENAEVIKNNQMSLVWVFLVAFFGPANECLQTLISNVFPYWT